MLLDPSGGNSETREQTFARLCKDLNTLCAFSDRAAHIDEADLHVSMQSQPELYTAWASLAAMAKNRVRRQDAHKETTLARVKARIRKKLEDAGEKTTEEKIKEMARCDPTYQDAVEKALDAEEIADYFIFAEKAMYQRRDMIKEMNTWRGREYSQLRDSEGRGQGSPSAKHPLPSLEALEAERRRQLEERNGSLEKGEIPASDG
jgi:hypothetical protein